MPVRIKVRGRAWWERDIHKIYRCTIDTYGYIRYTDGTHTRTKVCVHTHRYMYSIFIYLYTYVYDGSCGDEAVVPCLLEMGINNKSLSADG